MLRDGNTTCVTTMFPLFDSPSSSITYYGKRGNGVVGLVFSKMISKWDECMDSCRSDGSILLMKKYN